MGDVYRAEDLTLDQPVALKFLPEGVAAHPDRLAQFHHELRVARQVSHKNVCRLYDLGDADGRRFLTMEYVDGEDLASLLRRIGRLPADKALDIARQLCAGLAAAHERGILHRDLKPANVMLDGSGNVRITDFGLAAAEGDTAAGHAGTPQYMAPEQLKGAPASVKSDLYALGLVLFEIFTGRRAYEAKTLNELIELHDGAAPTTPSSIVRDLDPAAERVILRCLERDPAHRPGSALAVAAALPGGDPLAAALAAGETPSPEMLAAAGQMDALPAARGGAAVAVFLAVLVAFAAVDGRGSLIQLAPLEKPTPVLVDRAQQIVAALGYQGAALDTASGYFHAFDYTNWIMRNDRGSRRWDGLRSGRPAALLFWYRTSPRDMAPIHQSAMLVTPSDPPVDDSDMRLVVLDTLGRLVEFHSVPAQHDPDAAPAPAPRWDALFEAAGLPMSAFAPAAPEWTPHDYADVRAAWEGTPPDVPHRLRIEAAAYRGRPVSFAIVGPWSRASRMDRPERSRLDRVLVTFLIGLFVLAVCGAVLLMRHNLRAGRGDLKGATRLALFMSALGSAQWTVAAHHVADVVGEFQLFVKLFEEQLAIAAVVWVVYVAIEPFARRFWPDGLLGWSRLLSGRIHDPRAGRDILVGIVFGAALLVTVAARALLPGALGYPAVLPWLGADHRALTGLAGTLSIWCEGVFDSIVGPLLFVIVFVMLRLAVRRRWIATAVGLLLMGIVETSNLATVLWLDLTIQAVMVLLVATVILRYGLLAAVVAFFVLNVGAAMPMTLHSSLWWAIGSNLTIALFVALAAFGFYASRAGEPLFGHLLPRD